MAEIGSISVNFNPLSLPSILQYLDKLPLGIQCSKRLKTNAKMAFFTDLLVRCFSNNSYLLKTGRNLALDLINNNLHLKNFFTNRAMGVDL